MHRAAMHCNREDEAVGYDLDSLVPERPKQS
jgi:hypothetical protein